LKHTIALAAALLAAWFLWSNYFVPLLISLGVVSVFIVVVLSRRMKLVDEEGVPFHLLPRLFLYAPWLVWEVVKANLDVAKRVLRPDLPIHPMLIKVKAGQKSDLGRVIYANSITLTPGTVSVDVDGETITVHALSREAADGVLSGEMDARVTKLEGRS